MVDEANPSRLSALFPLALLEALRQHDLPAEVLEDEDFTESLPRRLGLSDVVYAQIQRYEDALRRSQPVSTEEVLSLLRLVLRRSDAPTVLREAGTAISRRYFSRSRHPAAAQFFGHGLPRPLVLGALRHATQRLLSRLLGRNTAEVGGRPLVARIRHPFTTATEGDGTACVLFSATIEELFFLYTRRRPSVLHSLCESRGDAVCEWTVAG